MRPSNSITQFVRDRFYNIAVELLKPIIRQATAEI